jgi:hypothetical protein
LSFLDSVKQDIQQYFATRKGIGEHRTGSFSNLVAPRSLGLFFCIETKHELDQIRALLSQVKSQHKNVTALIFSLSYVTLDVVTDQSIFMFDLNDFNLFGKKKENLMQEFKRLHFELLVSFVFNNNPFTLKLLSEIKADFKIGPAIEGGEILYDMTLSHKPDLFGIAGFYQNIWHYLGVLNIRKFKRNSAASME